jgi:hypothetical protein
LFPLDLVRSQYCGPPRPHRSNAARFSKRRALLRTVGSVGEAAAAAPGTLRLLVVVAAMAATGASAFLPVDLTTRLSLKILYSESTETKIFPPFLLPLLALNQYLDAPTLNLGWTIFNLHHVRNAEI